MSEGSHEIEVVCRLTTAELRERKATLIREFRAAVIGIEELPDGYAFGLSADEKWIRIVAELIAAERECCPFLTFNLTAHANFGPLILAITGPGDAKDFLRISFETESIPSQRGL